MRAINVRCLEDVNLDELDVKKVDEQKAVVDAAEPFQRVSLARVRELLARPLKRDASSAVW